MKITLSQLNESYQALVRLAQSDFPKEQHKLAYKLSRVVKTAKIEVEAATESANDLMRKCGVEPGQEKPDPEMWADFQAQFKAFMASTNCELWGDPIHFEEIAGVVAISPFDLALLDWLIVEEQEQPEASPYIASVALLAKTETA
jgi:hypothetical protein